MRNTLLQFTFVLLSLVLLPAGGLSAADKQMVSTSVSYSGPARVSAGLARLGQADAFNTSVLYSWQERASADLSWSLGVFWERFGFGVPANAPIPNTVQTLALDIGSSWNITDKWSLRASLRPGLQSDFEDLSASDLNATALIALAYRQSSNLTWLAAVTVDPRRDIPAIGGIGVRWRLAEDWTLSAVLPKPTLEYQIQPDWTVYGGGELVGGAWRVNETFGTRNGRAALNDQTMTYREIRVGAGLTTRWTSHLSVGVEGGWVVDRRFVYNDARLQLNGDGAPYFSVSVTGRF